jgi:biotin carboxyl carrier protein
MTRILWNGQENDLKSLKLENGVLSGVVNGETVTLSVMTDPDGRIASAIVNGRPEAVFAATKGEHTWLQLDGQVQLFQFSRGREGASSEHESDGSVKSPMPGKILELMAGVGDSVEKDQVLVLMESMKLQVEIRSPFDGTVASCPVSVGDMVDGDSLLMEIAASQQ